ncbi:four helix bundle protein [Zeaxanthinibacter enoshimensis]|uniref:Four helix bundle protein n=1 Tax=Zeaxanthinibacter enoshimensis TaxID=392009 RepID=A0A4R6TIP0_9FLAO|nr:four helix bundle protein [Zeaxanthinibacter enoshimensis]TDQ29086.1 four helix bundle protein [Zeaxanthinibacter enoshimensis]
MTHKNLLIWKKSMELVMVIYQTTRAFPESEKYGLIQHLRKTVISIPSNIAEGAGRGTTREYLRFLDIATGSLAELETQLIISKELGYILHSETINKEIRSLNHLFRKMKDSLGNKLNS